MGWGTRDIIDSFSGSSGGAAKKVRNTAADMEKKRRKQEAADRISQTGQNARVGEVLKGGGNEDIIFGTRQEREGQLAGLQTGNIAYGQGLGQTGQDIQGVKRDYESLYAGASTNPIVAAIQGQKAGAMANANRQSAASGIKGSAAANISQSVGNQKDQDIAAAMSGIQNQALGARRSMASNMVGGQTGLMYGSKAEGTAKNMPQAPDSGGMSVVCTELHRQGLMSDELYAKDSEYGWMLYYKNPNIFIGYHFLVKPIVKLMQKKLFGNKHYEISCNQMG